MERYNHFLDEIDSRDYKGQSNFGLVVAWFVSLLVIALVILTFINHWLNYSLNH